METSLTVEQEQSLTQEISPVVQMAKDLVVKSVEQSLEAQEGLREIKAKQKKIKEFFKPMKDAAKAAHQAICDRENAFLEPLEQAETVTKGKVVAFQIEEDRKAQEVARIAEAKRREEERKQREKIEEQARKAREAGKVEKAEALEQKAETVTVAPAFTPPPVVSKAQGSSFPKTWVGECIDLKLLCRSIADGKAPLNLVAPNQSAINAFAKGVKDTMPVDGLVFKEKMNMSMRAA